MLAPKTGYEYKITWAKNGLQSAWCVESNEHLATGKPDELAAKVDVAVMHFSHTWENPDWECSKCKPWVDAWEAHHDHTPSSYDPDCQFCVLYWWHTLPD